MGVDISYIPANTDDLVIHFTVSAAPRHDKLVGYGSELPQTARPAMLGGRRGLYAPARGPAPCCNHAIFVWSEAGRRYAASLHTVGSVTRQLFDAVLDRYEVPGSAKSR